MTPCREETELGRVLSELCPGIAFDEAVVHHYYVTLASLIGGWLSEQGRLETSPLKKTLLTLAKDLSAASVLLSGLETGLRTDLEIEITSRVQKLMALDPTIGPLARDRLSSFRRDADCISHACLIAAFDLPSGPEKRGRLRGQEDRTQDGASGNPEWSDHAEGLPSAGIGPAAKRQHFSGHG
jgi:hypothetical protein